MKAARALILFVILTIFYPQSLVFGQGSSTTKSEVTITSLQKDGKTIGQFTSQRNLNKTNSLVLLISIDLKNNPRAKDFRYIASIASGIYEQVNGSGKKHSYKAQVHVSKIYNNDSPTFIEVSYYSQFPQLPEEELDSLKSKFESLF